MAETIMIDSVAPSFAYLVVSEGMRCGAIYTLNSSRTSLGRTGGSNDIVLGDDSTVSSQHANVRLEPDGCYYLVDLDSSNGSFVNGQRISRMKISNNDWIILGKTQLVFKHLIRAG